MLSWSLQSKGFKGTYVTFEMKTTWKYIFVNQQNWSACLGV